MHYLMYRVVVRGFITFVMRTEGSYIGQVAADGQVRVWRCSDGQCYMTTAYGTGGQTANSTKLSSYK